LAFNLVMFWLMLWGGALNQLGMASVGGIAGAALVTTLASQGTQYFGGFLVARGVGDANRNTLVGLLVNVTLAALGTAGVPGAREGFFFLGFGLGGTLFLVGLLSDLRSVAAPKGGIGLYFGTFNPFHNTHLSIIQAAIEERGTRQGRHPPRSGSQAARRFVPQGRASGRSPEGWVPGLREDRQGRFQRRLFPHGKRRSCPRKRVWR